MGHPELQGYLELRITPEFQHWTHLGISNERNVAAPWKKADRKSTSCATCEGQYLDRR